MASIENLPSLPCRLPQAMLLQHQNRPPCLSHLIAPEFENDDVEMTLDPPSWIEHFDFNETLPNLQPSNLGSASGPAFSPDEGGNDGLTGGLPVVSPNPPFLSDAASSLPPTFWPATSLNGPTVSGFELNDVEMTLDPLSWPESSDFNEALPNLQPNNPGFGLGPAFTLNMPSSDAIFNEPQPASDLPLAPAFWDGRDSTGTYPAAVTMTENVSATDCPIPAPTTMQVPQVPRKNTRVRARVSEAEWNTHKARIIDYLTMKDLT